MFWFKKRAKRKESPNDFKLPQPEEIVKDLISELRRLGFLRPGDDEQVLLSLVLKSHFLRFGNATAKTILNFYKS